MKRILTYILTIITVVAILDYIGKPEPKYKVNDCVKDQIHGDLRKITHVGVFVYNYCKMKDNECRKGYSMRIKDFNRIMIKNTCKGGLND